MLNLIDKYSDPKLLDRSKTARDISGSFKDKFPTRRSEEWRYSDISKFSPIVINIDKDQDVDKKHISFKNGNFRDFGLECKKGGQVSSEDLESIHSKIHSNTNNPFNSYNITSSENLYIFDIYKKSETLEFFMDMEMDSLVVFKIKKGSDLTILLHNNLSREFLNLSLLIDIEDGGKCNLIFDGASDKGSIRLINSVVELGNRSEFNGFLLNSVSKYSRNDVTIRFNDEDSSYSLYGLSFCEDGMESHNLVRIEHKSKNCTGKQLFKNILLGRSKTSFDGLVHVFKGSSGTESDQMNGNLILSDDAKAYARPQLKIYNDDVVCNHGSNNGELDIEKIHYLKSRGFNENLARSILINGFAGEVLDKIPINSVKEKYTNYIENKISNW
ncbi:MAG: hypothetical protein CR982_05710 [Candidatus Cloacimonadota bacterium]|nr:MAG: hypothetical protein CR982_05710 [Candidatus Cloacimonadota bacterium]PIE81383.1 MAG: hypothetical protein CSA15_00660 [Candidatus Delongbacteria bacterium]